MYFVKFTDEINNTYVYLHVHLKHSFLPKTISSCIKTYYFDVYLVCS